MLLEMKSAESFVHHVFSYVPSSCLSNSFDEQAKICFAHLHYSDVPNQGLTLYGHRPTRYQTTLGILSVHLQKDQLSVAAKL